MSLRSRTGLLLPDWKGRLLFGLTPPIILAHRLKRPQVVDYERSWTNFKAGCSMFALPEHDKQQQTEYQAVYNERHQAKSLKELEKQVDTDHGTDK